MIVKFMWNGIKVDGKNYKAKYSIGPWTKESGLPDGTITIYADSYTRFPHIDGLTVINDSDVMTDYFDKDRICIFPGNKLYVEVKAAFDKQEAHNAKQREKYRTRKTA